MDTDTVCKRYRTINVLDAAKARIRLAFEHFEQICVAFSGGKDSTVLLHLARDIARELGRGPVHVLFIDLEGQYQATIEHVTAMLSLPDVRPWWICLPMNLRNAASMEEPFWCAWEPTRQADWIRPRPDHPGVIHDPEFFPFYQYRMEFEAFVPAFNQWLSRDQRTAFLVGIRADESLHRYLAVKPYSRHKKSAWTPPAGDPLAWTARDPAHANAVNFFPLYDWKFHDIWRYIGEHALPYNRLYDHMHRAGVSFSQMRVCQPYGDDQRKSLDLMHRLEPATWFRAVHRVAGANYAARYCRQRLLGYRGSLGLPPTMNSWRQYAEFLLRSLPDPLRCLYERRIYRYILWWKKHDYPLAYWPDAGVPQLENRRAQPSWRCVAMSLLKQDLGRSLACGPQRNDHAAPAWTWARSKPKPWH